MNEIVGWRCGTSFHAGEGARALPSLKGDGMHCGPVPTSTLVHRCRQLAQGVGESLQCFEACFPPAGARESLSATGKSALGSWTTFRTAPAHMRSPLTWRGGTLDDEMQEFVALLRVGPGFPACDGFLLHLCDSRHHSSSGQVEMARRSFTTAGNSYGGASKCFHAQ